MSGSFFPPPTPSLPIFHLIPGGKSNKGVKVLGNCSGSGFGPNQVLLSKNFCPTPGSRQKFLLRTSGVWGWESKLDPHDDG